jgi:hypothetical protein
MHQDRATIYERDGSHCGQPQASAAKKLVAPYLSSPQRRFHARAELHATNGGRSALYYPKSARKQAFATIGRPLSRVKYRVSS